MTTTSEITDRYRDFVNCASLGLVETASTWYLTAHEVALEMIHANNSLTVETASSIIAAFSPRERWATNVAKAMEFACGGVPTGLSQNLRMAINAKADGFAALNGPKTNAFARAIAGDVDAVVIDVWMCRAAGVKDSPSKGEYTMCADAIRTIATETGLSPRTVQALIWIVVRGGAE